MFMVTEVFEMMCSKKSIIFDLFLIFFQFSQIIPKHFRFFIELSNFLSAFTILFSCFLSSFPSSSHIFLSSYYFSSTSSFFSIISRVCNLYSRRNHYYFIMFQKEKNLTVKIFYSRGIFSKISGDVRLFR